MVFVSVAAAAVWRSAALQLSQPKYRNHPMRRATGFLSLRGLTCGQIQTADAIPLRFHFRATE
jgi:hypothetical protein